MGSKRSSSSTASTTTTTTNTKNFNVTDTQAPVIISDKEVTVTDGGAFDLVAEITSKAINAIAENNQAVFEGAKEFAENQSKENKDFAQSLARPDSDIINNVVKYGAMAAAVYAVMV